MEGFLRWVLLAAVCGAAGCQATFSASVSHNDGPTVSRAEILLTK